MSRRSKSGPQTSAIKVADRDRAISADVYKYQAEICLRARPAKAPRWFGTLAHDPELTDFSD